MRRRSVDQYGRTLTPLVLYAIALYTVVNALKELGSAKPK
jgi:hypothetical protein